MAAVAELLHTAGVEFAVEDVPWVEHTDPDEVVLHADVLAPSLFGGHRLPRIGERPTSLIRDAMLMILPDFAASIGFAAACEQRNALTVIQLDGE